MGIKSDKEVNPPFPDALLCGKLDERLHHSITLKLLKKRS